MPNTPNLILVPLGFSEQSFIALEQACNLAKINKSRIKILSVVEEPTKMEVLFTDNKVHEIQKKVNKRLLEISQEFTKKYSVDIEVMVALGRVHEQINEVANMLNVNLIVMGTDSTSNKSRLRKFIGSNAERVVRSANCPVITIKGKEHRDGCKNIILPLDSERETKEKVNYAIKYAKYWKSTIKIVSLSEEDSLNKLISNINQVKKYILDSGISCTSELIENSGNMQLGPHVIDFSLKYKGDLIIIMTRKEELSFSNSLSSTARYIINSSKIPVMSIRPKERKHLTGPTTAF